MKKTLFILTAISLIAASCAKEVMKSNDTETKTKGRTVLTVNMPDETKVNIGEAGNRVLYWSEGDRLSWNGEASNPLEIDNDEPNSKTGTFTWDKVLDRPGKLIYPASFWKDGYHITLPANQGTMEGTDDIAPNSFPLCGYVEKGAGSKNLSPLCAIVRLQIKNAKDEAVTLKKVSFSGNNNEQVSGVFTIDYQNCSLTDATAANDADKSTSVSCDKTLSKSDAIFVNMVVPARTYSDGVKFKLESKDGFYMIKSKSKQTIFERGKVYSFPVFEYIPNGVSDGIGISSAEDLVLFAKNYNEKKYNKPVAFLTQDITFDDKTNADFLATGGIGTQEENEQGETVTNYFNGEFYGMNHSIKNWKNYSVDESGAINTSAPLFAFTGSSGYIQDLVLDSTCDLAFPKGNAGPLVGRHKGKLLNCINNANVDFRMVDGTTNFGGLVGRVYGGTVEKCTMNGQLKNTSTESVTKTYSVGGIAATLEDGGTIKDCFNNGNTIWRVDPTIGASGPQLQNGILYLGGIVGNIIKGTVSSCVSYAKNTTSSDIRGNAGTAFIGGVAGYVQAAGTVESCKNSRRFYVRLSSGDVLYLGGIAGNNKGTISGTNKNTAQITGNGGQPTICVGGLAGNNEGSITSTGEVNSGGIIGPSQYTTVSTCYLGGLVGKTTKSLSGMNNSGSISCTPIKGVSGSVGFYLAGCAAYAGSEAELSQLTNTGKVTLGEKTWEVSSTIAEMVLGGIAAKAESSIEGCQNKADSIIINGTGSLMENNAVIGGVAGQITESVSLKDNINSSSLSIASPFDFICIGGLYGSVEKSNTLNVTGSPFTGSISILSHGSGIDTYLFAGGIVGLAKAALTITGTNCSLTSDITIPASSFEAAELCMGGVVGAAGENGAGNTVSGAKVTISGITVNGKVKMAGEGTGLFPKYKKAALGGVIGGAFAGADISSCTSSSNVYFCEGATASNSNGNPAHLGGIAGRIEGGKSTISGCAASGKVYNYLYNNNWWPTNNQVGINAVGGILGSFGYNYNNEFDITIQNCSSTATCYAYRGAAGGIAGYLHNAIIKDINTFTIFTKFTGKVSRGAPAGGIVAIARKCNISGCTVNSNQIEGQSAGSTYGHAGGIIGYADETHVEGCNSFTTLLKAEAGTGNTALPGGIIGCPEDNCTIGNTTQCRCGGKIYKSHKVGNQIIVDINNVEITSGNVAQYAVGNDEMTTSPNVGYWNGK